MGQKICLSSWRNITSNVDSHYVQRVFTNGECGTLALAIHVITELPLVGEKYCHYAVKYKNGFIDIGGYQPKKDFEYYWGELKPVTFNEVINFYVEVERANSKHGKRRTRKGMIEDVNKTLFIAKELCRRNNVPFRNVSVNYHI